MLTGKGMYIWKIKECDGGDIAKIVSRCVNAKFSHVLIKIADGTYGYNCLSVDKAKELADALEAVNIEPWGWQYVFGNDPVGEARTATRRMNETGCVGFVINAEQQYRDLPNNQAVALQYVQRLLFETPIALSSYRYPKLHGNLPWLEFLGVCDLIMPQVYWMGATNSADQLWQCVEEYRTFTDLPIFPTGAAFCEHGWCPTNEEIIAFVDEAKRLGLPGVNFWEFARSRKDGFWQTVRDLEYFKGAPNGHNGHDCCEEHAIAIDNIKHNQANLYEITDANADDIDTLRQREIDHTREHNAEFGELREALEVYAKLNNDKVNTSVAEIEQLKEESVEDGMAIEKLGVASSNHLLRLQKQKNDIAEVLRRLEEITSNQNDLGNNQAEIYSEIERIDKDINELELQNNHTHPWWAKWLIG